MPHRRTLLTGLAALPLVPAPALAQPAAAPTYDYHFLTLASPPAPAFVDHVRTTLRPAVEARGDVLLGLFTPQLGWASNEAALLIRRRAQAPADLALDPRLVRSARRDVLTPTGRRAPRPRRHLRPPLVRGRDPQRSRIRRPVGGGLARFRG